MRYLVKARVKAEKENQLWQAIADGALGKGSVAGDEYLNNMAQARVSEDGAVHWVEVCFCTTPLEEERSYWEKYFELVGVNDAHARKNCRDENGTEPRGRAAIAIVRGKIGAKRARISGTVAPFTKS